MRRLRLAHDLSQEGLAHAAELSQDQISDIENAKHSVTLDNIPRLTRRLRIISFLAAIGCFAAAAGISYLGFEVWPPSATLADGRSALFPPADIQVCIKARGLARLARGTLTDSLHRGFARIQWPPDPTVRDGSRSILEFELIARVVGVTSP
ncbi:helix-turn-helix domain-containing protein [Bradyrhizobium sp. DASA03068]|uniref:helix-turn-helix domain-containing protein n=1 Tax=Bradyrhizobium sp. BLXBL-01 TaxID=3395915 RepID=UPI003F7058CD